MKFPPLWLPQQQSTEMVRREVATARLFADGMSIPPCQLHNSTWTSQLEVLSLWYFIFEISIKQPGSGFEGLTSADGALEQ